MKTKIGKFDAATGTVAVTFTQGKIVHDRTVNACLDGDGAYDADATKARVADVARGVEVKMGLGVIGNPPETDEPTPAEISAT